MATVRVIEGDCLQVLPTMEAGSVDAVITDPPYPEIDRQYGRWTEADWWELMMGVVRETRRVLKPTGSAVFILQPNSRKVGSMRGWLWEFMAWVCREWNMVQDAWWWKYDALPLGGCNSHGLLRPSLKACVWLGPPDCWRDQSAVLWDESQRNATLRVSARAGRRKFPSGRTVDDLAGRSAAVVRGGVTPFNVVPVPSDDTSKGAAAHGHGAGTPLALMRWWTRYVCPPGGTVLDPFAGSGTAGVAAIAEGRNAILIEQHPPYVEIIRRRIAAETSKTPLFDGSE
jgi:hypothetical protein